MAKLTKEQSKKHQQCLELINSDKPLTWEEKDYIIENYQESYAQLNSLSGAFFTPEGLARDFNLEVPENADIVDLCAGIGCLSLWALRMKHPKSIKCVELNPDYIKVGKRILPEAEWVNSDALDFCDALSKTQQMFGVGKTFDVAVSNPPFGRINTSENNTCIYTGGDFEFKIIEKSMLVARDGVFIVPQGSTPFKYSGQHSFQQLKTGKAINFMSQTGIHLEPNCGIDTSIYKNEWKGVSVICEVVLASC
ncbi:methyltransferase [Phage vB_KsaM-C1]|nr:methyltransferase [Phage vB_KsaM-C1]